jgi:hypothetical protein
MLVLLERKNDMIPFNDPSRILRHIAIGIIGFIILFGLLMLYMKIQDNRYPLVETNTHISGTVKFANPYQSITKIEMDSSLRFRLPASRNYKYIPFHLNEFLQTGDSIVKKYSTDTLWIYRKDEKFYFCLGKIVNE